MGNGHLPEPRNSSHHIGAFTTVSMSVNGTVHGVDSNCSMIELVTQVVQDLSSHADLDAPIMELGIDSLGAADISSRMSASAGRALPPALVFDFPTIRQLGNHLEALITCSTTGSAFCAAISIDSRQQPQSAAVSGSQPMLIAIAFTLPGGLVAHVTDHALQNGCESITEVPIERWEDCMPQASELVQSRLRFGGFVLMAELFDCVKYRISPVEAISMDPQQRLLLEHVDAAAVGCVDTAHVGVFVGISSTEFGVVMSNHPLSGRVYASTASSLSVASGRISFVLGLQGPCVSYETACSSSLVANHGGMRALQYCECTLSFASGVNLMLLPLSSMGIAVAGMTSPRGRCHTFDARADGYVRSEACSSVALDCNLEERGIPKLLGSAVRQDGRSASLTAPNGQAQQGLLYAALQDASSSAISLGLNEAHGTGTALGDPIEVGSLFAAILSKREEALAVGGVKANTGHAESAAGLVGLLKLVPSMNFVKAMPNAQLRALNQHVCGEVRSVACALLVQLSALTTSSGGVSSFGYSGTIAHALAACDGGGEVLPLGHCEYSSDISSDGVERQMAALRSRRYEVTNSHCDVHARNLLLSRRRRFDWRSVIITSDAIRMQLYSTSWTPLTPASVAPPAPCVLLTKSSVSGYTAAMLLSWRALVMVFPPGVSGIPSLHGVLLGLALTQSLVGHATVPPHVLMLTCHALASSGGPMVPNAAHSGVWGVAGVLRLEHPTLHAQSADISHGARHAALPAIHAPLSEVEMAWRGEARCAARLRACTAGVQRDATPGCGMCTITGGLGGLGLCAAAQLLARGMAGVVLSSRSGHVQRNGQDGKTPLVVLSMAVVVTISDVGDAADALALLTRRCCSSILHAAGVLRDMLLRAMAASDLEASFVPKAIAASHIHAIGACTPPEALALFSSIASTFGNVGQANYAAANAYLDGLASCRRQHGCLATSLQIPAVSGAGMSASTFGEQQLEMIGAIRLSEFASWLSQCLTPALPSAERTQACLTPLLVETDPARRTSLVHSFSEVSPSPGLAPACEEEALLVQQGTTLPVASGCLIHLRVAERVALLELHDPLHFNTLTIEMASDMQAAVQWVEVQAHGVMQSIVLLGAGEHFCPGGNLHRKAAQPSSLAAGARKSIDLFAGFCRLRILPVPVMCAAHGAVLGGGLAICLLTDHVTSSETATFQVGERSRGIYPAGLLTQTLADAMGAEAANQFYLTEAKLSASCACEVGLVQAVTSSKAGAQGLACDVARWYAFSADEAMHSSATGDRRTGLQALTDELPSSDRRVLAISAFAQVRSLHANSMGLSVDSPVFSSGEKPLTRGALRRHIQGVASASSDTQADSLLHKLLAQEPVNYTVDDGESDVAAKDTLMQLLQRLTRDQQSSQGTAEVMGTNANVASGAERVELTPLAAGFADALSQRSDASPFHLLMEAWAALGNSLGGVTVPFDSQLHVLKHQDAEMFVTVDARQKLLLRLRLAQVATPTHPPLVIGHSLLGDHKGYGRLWTLALEQSEVYALRHRGLMTDDALVLNREGALSMVSEYACVVELTFASAAFDLIGASFGAILAAHVAHAARAIGGYPRRIVLIDPPPTVPQELPVPKMLTRWDRPAGQRHIVL